MANLFTATGTVLAMTATTTPPATFDAAGYAALTYLDVGCAESYGSFGGEKTITEFICINDGIVQKVNGSVNYGNLEVTLALNDATSAWDAIHTAFDDKSAGDYHFKVQYPNAQNSTGTGAIRYFSGKVSSVKENVSGANDVVTVTLTIAITGKIVIVDSTAGA